MKKIKYRGLHGYKYQLMRTIIIQTSIMPEKDIYIGNWLSLKTTGLFKITIGYCCDGPTPGWLFSRRQLKKTKFSKWIAKVLRQLLRGAFIHDGLYQFLRSGKLNIKWRKAIDRLLQQMAMEDGMSGKSASIVYGAVQILGKQYAMPQKPTEPKIQYAP